jgi:hypothetical protein
MEKKNTKIEYMYRDGSNYKTYREEVLQGELTSLQIAEIKSNLQDGEYFIPSQVGLDDLQAELQKYDSRDYDDDLSLHEFLEVELVSDTPTIEMTAEEFYNKFVNIRSWNSIGEVGHILSGDFAGKTPSKHINQ